MSNYPDLTLLIVMLLLQLRLLTGPRLASIEEITAVHDTDYVQQLQETIETQAPTVVADFDDPDGFTYVTNTSFDDARKVHAPSLGARLPACTLKWHCDLLAWACMQWRMTLPTSCLS